ncbi:MAG: BUG/TctC family periplasmic protein, partial [uncultured Acetobacteraceae bacterium]
EAPRPSPASRHRPHGNGPRAAGTCRLLLEPRPPGPLRRRLRAGRQHRHHRARGGARDHRGAGPARGGGEPHRRGGQRGHRARGPQRPRRAHPRRGVHGLARDQRGALPRPALRRGARLRSRLARRPERVPPRGASLLARAERRGAGRPRQGQPGGTELRHRRSRQLAALRGGAVRAPGRGALHPGLLPRRRAGHGRPGVRAPRPDVHSRGRNHPAGPVGAGQGARHDAAGALRGTVGRAGGRRGAARLRFHQLARAVRARRHARARGGAHRPRGRGGPARRAYARADGAARLRAGREHAWGVRRLLRRRTAQGDRARAHLRRVRGL